jgi:hypothetical protein
MTSSTHCWASPAEPLVRLIRLRVLLTDQSAAHWVHRSVALQPVSKPERLRLAQSAGHSSLAKRAHSPLTCLLFRVPSHSNLAPVLSVRDFTCLGFVPLRDFTLARPLFARLPKVSLRSVLRLSQPLDGLLRPKASRACFIPLPRPGSILFRGFSLRAATLPHRKEPAPMPL